MQTKRLTILCLASLILIGCNIDEYVEQLDLDDLAEEADIKMGPDRTLDVTEKENKTIEHLCEYFSAQEILCLVNPSSAKEIEKCLCKAEDKTLFWVFKNKILEQQSQIKNYTDALEVPWCSNDWCEGSACLICRDMEGL